MKTVINFAEPESFKAVICPLGLEELRSVVYYELVNLFLLITAVRHNQKLLDTPMRWLAEISAFEKGFIVTAQSWDIIGKLHGQNLYESNLRKMPSFERQRVRNKISGFSNIGYGILSKKMILKDKIEKHFKSFKTAVGVQASDDKVEIGLRYLRTCRMALLNDYCKDLTATVSMDQVKLELLEETRALTNRQYLLPKEAVFFNMNPPEFGEAYWQAHAEGRPECLDNNSSN